MRPRVRRAAVRAALVALACGGPARAQVDAQALVRAVTHPARLGGGASCRDLVPAPFRAPGSERMSVLIELAPNGSLQRGWREVAPGLAAAEVGPAELEGMGAALRVAWAPGRHLQLDRADGWTRASWFRERAGISGAGAIVGVVDAGLDASHPDLRHPDGSTRVAWYLDLGRDPAGRHPELEEEYGCTAGSGFRCAVLGGDDIDELLASPGTLDEPRDISGHGTHVASLAAGNGLGGAGRQFVGMAPEATLVAVRATRGVESTILDADALLATRFIFERAAELGLPAVVNLSLGTDFGAHDGSSLLERGLAAFVGPDEPGRAIVVAAGNSGHLHVGRTDRYAEPLGIHTEVHVPYDSTARVPLLTPSTGGSVTRATLLVWIAARPGDALQVGVDDADGRWIDPVAPGDSRTHQDGDLEVTILNGTGVHAGAPVRPTSAVVIVDGSWASGATFAIRLRGHGTARLWVQSEGDLGPATGRMGAVFPRARRAGTINVPGTHPDLIAVGATVNRSEWIDRSGGAVQIDQILADQTWTPGAAAHYSAAGPTAAGLLKPDLVAPGAYVGGAMSDLADPTRNDVSTIFSDPGLCLSQLDCLVLDERHALSSGTSMAAPLVAGAAALLLARDPELTQGEMRNLLQAGARRPEGAAAAEQQLGPGALDLDRSLDAQLLSEAAEGGAARLPSAEASWLVLADGYAHPDLDWPLWGLVLLRTGDGTIAHGFDAERLRLEAPPADVVHPLERLAPGLWRFAVAAPAGSGGEHIELSILFDGERLLRRTVPVAVDPWVLEQGASARGGCSTSARRPPGPQPWLVVGVGLLLALGRRRDYRRAR